LSYTPTGRESLSFWSGLALELDGPSLETGIHRAPMPRRPSMPQRRTRCKGAHRDGDRLSGPILPRLYSPRSLNDGWSAGRGPSASGIFALDSLNRQVVDAGDAQAPSGHARQTPSSRAVGRNTPRDRPCHSIGEATRFDCRANVRLP